MTQYDISSLALDPVVNFGKVTVSTGYTDLDTIIVLSPDNGAKLPNPSTSGPFNLVWWNSTDYPDPSDDPNVEIVRCTDNTTDVLTVIREQEGILKSNKNIPAKTYKMILSPTKKTITDIPADTQSRVNSSISTHAALTTGVHGAGVSTIETITGSQAKVDAHKDLTTGVHGAGASTIETISGSQTKVNTHAALDVAVSVHPNANTHIGASSGVHGVGASTVESIAGSQAKVNNHAALDVAAGVHPNANTHIAAAAPHSGHLIANTVTWIGNGTQNRAIAHGLGRTPKGYIITRDADDMAAVATKSTRFTAQYGVGHGGITVTAWDSTNIYVGGPGGAYNNDNTYAFTAVIFG